MANYFSLKVAGEQSFCNRTEEVKSLLNNIEKARNTVITAPRRYGKTSLVCNALKQAKLPFTRVDLFCVVYEEDVCSKIARGISELINQMTTFSEKTLKVIEKCFKSAYIGFSSGNIELKLGFEKSVITTPLEQLQDLLFGIEALAKKRQQKAIIFLDEFQDVLKLGETNQVQAVIRDAAQHAKYITYVFSGSSRRMLTEIFEDKNQPLYMLCRKIILERIGPEHFKKHIQKAAKNQWGEPLQDELVQEILELTQCHTYYVNMLCDILWDQNKPPTKARICSAWEECLFENKGKIISDLETLNTNRAKTLITIAVLGVVNEPNGRAFLDRVKLPLSTVQKSIKYLLVDDYIYEKDGGIQCVDPLMRKFILDYVV